MAHLTLAGMSEDGKRLLLIDDQGNEHTLDANAALRKVLRGEHERLGKLEIHMDSALRPREIQARIRAGETPDAVAQAAQTTVDEIMPYANPVLAERAHLADRAQRASLRRPAGEPGARTLGESVGAHLRGLNIAEDSLEWDAWRRADGRWTVVGSFTAPQRKGTATFAFDAPGNYVVAEDDDAKWLVGEATEKPKASGPKEPRQRRLAAVSADELPLGEDALEMVSDTVDLTETADAVRDAGQPSDPDHAESPFLASAFERQNTGDSPSEVASEALTPIDGASPVDSDPVHDAGEPATDSADESADSDQSRRPVNKKRGRASVPSWDEIMFGGSDQES